MTDCEPPLNIVIRTADHVVIKADTRAKHPAGTFAAEEMGERITGDVRDCPLAFSAGGTLCACADTSSVFVLRTDVGSVVLQVPEEKVIALQFSPCGTFLVAYRHPDRNSEAGNMAVFLIETGTEVLRCVQASWPCLQWTADESLCIRLALGLVMVHDGKFESKNPISKLELQLPKNKEPVVSLSPGSTPFLVAFKPQNKQKQAECRLFRLPSVKEDVYSVPFARADDANVQWNCNGSALAVTLKCEHDSSGKSYYGTTAFALINVRDKTTTDIKLAEGESIHDCQWSPGGGEFIIIHGIMPRNKATLYSATGVAIYTFGEAPRNLVKWAPNAEFFVLGGTGNLAGEFQFYNRKALNDGKSKVSGDGKLGNFTEKSSVQEWSPCGRYLLCSTDFSHLRLDNKLVVWKHNGEKCFEQKFETLFNAHFVPHAPLLFKSRAPSPTRQVDEKPKPKAYVPPHRSAGAAALLARNPASAVGTAAKSTGPPGAQLVEEKKKKKRH